MTSIETSQRTHTVTYSYTRNPGSLGRSIRACGELVKCIRTLCQNQIECPLYTRITCRFLRLAGRREAPGGIPACRQSANLGIDK